ncbi:MAG TPA: ribosome maturation factor RimM [Acidimicrobiales bacterium]|nr:ribosome maturation factor RimM [Acidimicrobiales bacterium]
MGLLEIGRVVRPHGLRGEVVVELVTNRPDRLAPETLIAGPKGPLRITASRPFQARHLVQFDGVNTREQAELLRDFVLRAEPVAETDPDVLWVHELVGSEVRDAAGKPLGTVREVQDNPASDLLVLHDGGLIPCRFVVSSGQGVVTVDIPEGLLDPS